MTDTDTYQAFVRLKSLATGKWLAPPELRRRLVADSAESNLTDVIVGILGARYGVEYEPTGRKSNPVLRGDALNFAIPMPLKIAIGVAANEHGRGLIDEIRTALAEHYKLNMPGASRASRNGSR